MNKPNKQTVIVLSATMNFMKDLPFQKIRSLGGKLGDEIETELQVTTAGDLWKYSLDFLMKRFGEGTGLWLYNITRGICREEGEREREKKDIPNQFLFFSLSRSLYYRKYFKWKLTFLFFLL